MRCLPFEIKSRKMIRSHKIRHGYHFGLAIRPSLRWTDTGRPRHIINIVTPVNEQQSDFSIGHRYFTVTVHALQ